MIKKMITRFTRYCIWTGTAYLCGGGGGGGC